jgi:hypothetical protein
MDIPLQQRAGRNIGIESSPVFLQSAGGPEIAVKASGDTVIMEGVASAVRTPFTRGNFSGTVFNDTVAAFFFNVYFKDELGNELLLTTVQTVNPNSSIDLDLTGAGVFTPDLPLSLCEGEKLVLRSTTRPS